MKVDNMIKRITLQDFRNEFKRYNRDNFSYKGLEVLFDYLEGLEDDMQEPIELDVIGLCCDYSEYETLEDVQKDYNVEDMDELEGNTEVINFENGFIIRCY
jgi:hypothetical protein